jgi:hypothetical protein
MFKKLILFIKNKLGMPTYKVSHEDMLKELSSFFKTLETNPLQYISMDEVIDCLHKFVKIDKHNMYCFNRNDMNEFEKELSRIITDKYSKYRVDQVQKSMMENNVDFLE